MYLPSLRKDPFLLLFPSISLMSPIFLYQTLAFSHLLNKHALVAIPLKNKANQKQTKLSLTASAPNKFIFTFYNKTFQKELSTFHLQFGPSIGTAASLTPPCLWSSSTPPCLKKCTLPEVKTLSFVWLDHT